MLIEKNKLFRISINLLICLIALFAYYELNNPENTFLFLSALSIISFVVILRTCSEPISSPYSLFITVLFVYNCGQVWLNLFGVPIIQSNYAITRYSNELLATSLLFFILSVQSINTAFILRSRLKSSYTSSENKPIEGFVAPINRSIIPIFIFLFVLCLIYDIGQYRLASSMGYAAALYARSNNELLYMCNCSFPFVVFYVLRSNVSNRKKTFVFLVSVIRYAATTILIGYRMQAISFVLALIVLLYGIVDDRNKKKVTLLMIVGIVSVAFLSIVAANLRRGESIVGWWQSYNSLLQELGGTFTDLPIIIRDIDEIGVAYGLSYLCAALYLVPFIGHIIPGMSKYVNLSAILYTRITIYGNSSLGGSMLAEFFYNYKWCSIFILAPVVGWIFAKICNAINNKHDSPFRTAMLSYVFFIFLLYSRGNIGEITIYIRCVVYITILHKIFYRRRSL